MAAYWVVGLSLAASIAIIRWWLLPKPYPYIPYNKQSASRITGDIPDLVPVMKECNQVSHSMFTITTRKLGTPIAQLLFPNIRRPFVILEDPREIEDILLRRGKEFDRAATPSAIFQPMFPQATVAQFTTPKLKAQKRLWADVTSAEFLHKAAAPNIYKATIELLEYWRLKAATVYKDQAFNVHVDFQRATLDAIWVATMGEEPGLIRYEMNKLQYQLEGKSQEELDKLPLPKGMFLRDEVRYIGDAVERNTNSPLPKWAAKLETFRPRYRQFRAVVTKELTQVMTTAIDRFERLELHALEADESDTCMMDFVLRRKVIEARKAQKPMADLTKDQELLDEMFVMLVGGHDSTANVLAWFTKFMEAYPVVQNELRLQLRTAFPGPHLPSVQEILTTSIPYLDGVCEEGFRLAGVAKANFRQATVDTQILGYPIPKGTEIFLNFHMDTTPAPVDDSKRTASYKTATAKHGDLLQGNAGRDLNRFEPRRWLALDPKTGNETFNPNALPALAFGGGIRGCSGRKLAQMEFRLIVTLLILRLEFLELPEEYKSMDAIERVFRAPKYIPNCSQEVHNVVTYAA
ncbi:unnamed protein product [Clonostachys solani]|uniref:Cytochrome P450 n=1 Tax=Clonostachys solani TaxID=160281 RepID=A0A9N9ZAB7_9HYPO|nr:unnamed protein product [Clonostachys solani]